MKAGAASLTLCLASLAAPPPAEAVRWTLGVGTELVPVVLDAGRPEGLGTPLRLGVRPVIDLELSHYFAVGAYAPFVVYRRGEASSAASSGAESVFGLGASFRWPWLSDRPPEEILGYATLRGGFGTVSGRAGPYVGLGLGSAITWLETGRGLFAELTLDRLHVSGVAEGGASRDVERVTVGFTVGLHFRLGGEGWRLGRTRLVEEPAAE